MLLNLIRWLFFNGVYPDPRQKRKGLLASLISIIFFLGLILSSSFFIYKNLDLLGIDRKNVFGIDLIELINQEKIIKIKLSAINNINEIIEITENINDGTLIDVIKNKLLADFNKNKKNYNYVLETISCNDFKLIEFFNKQKFDNCFIEKKIIKQVPIKYNGNYYLVSYQINSIILKNNVLLNNKKYSTLEQYASVENNKWSFKGLNVSNEEILNFIIKKEYDYLVNKQKTQLKIKRETCPSEINTLKIYVKFECSLIKYVLENGNVINSSGDELIFNTELEEVVFTDIRL